MPPPIAKSCKKLFCPRRQASSKLNGEAMATIDSHNDRRKNMKENKRNATIPMKMVTVSTSTGGRVSPPAAKLITKVKIITMTTGTVTAANAISHINTVLKKYFRCRDNGIRLSLMPTCILGFK